MGKLSPRTSRNQKKTGTFPPSTVVSSATGDCEMVRGALNGRTAIFTREGLRTAFVSTLYLSFGTFNYEYFMKVTPLYEVNDVGLMLAVFMGRDLFAAGRAATAVSEESMSTRAAGILASRTGEGLRFGRTGASTMARTRKVSSTVSSCLWWRVFWTCVGALGIYSQLTCLHAQYWCRRRRCPHYSHWKVRWAVGRWYVVVKSRNFNDGAPSGFARIHCGLIGCFPFLCRRKKWPRSVLDEEQTRIVCKLQLMMHSRS